jgi:hypothetical protein
MVVDVLREPFQQDNRHVHDHVPSQILSVFARYYTTFDSGSAGVVENNSGSDSDELYKIIDHLESRNVEIQQVCDDRLVVIDGLSRAADERLRAINELTLVAEERMVVIRQLETEIKRLTQLKQD